MMRKIAITIWTQKLCLLLTCLIAGLFLHLSQKIYFSDSEIWLLTLSQKAFSVGSLLSIYYKWPFHAFIYFTTHWAPSELDTYLWARMSMGLVSLTSVYLTSKNVCKIFSNDKLFWPITLFLLCSTLFFTQGFRIRADAIAYFFHMSAISFALYIQNKKILWQHFLILILINTLTLTATPKFIYFLFAQFLSLSLIAIRHKHRHFFLLIWLSHLIPPLSFSIIITLSFIIPGWEWIHQTTSSVIDFYLKSFYSSLGTPHLFSISGFSYLIDFIKNNLFTSLVIYLWVFITVMQFCTRGIKLWSSSPHFLAFQIYNMTLLLCMLLHNQKLPFFLAFCLLPISAQSFAMLLDALYKYSFKAFQRLVFSLSILLALFIFSFYKKALYTTSNQPQRLVINEVDQYLQKNPELRIYDIIGINPRRTNIYAFVGPAEVAKKELILEKIKNENPDIILFVYKFMFLEPEIKDYIITNMIPLAPGAWGKGRVLDSTKNPEYFKNTVKINGMNYWVLPRPPEAYFYDPISRSLINDQIIHLDAHHKLSDSNSPLIGVPMEKTSLAISSLPPLNLSFSPFHVFRFDNGT